MPMAKQTIDKICCGLRAVTPNIVPRTSPRKNSSVKRIVPTPSRYTAPRKRNGTQSDNPKSANRHPDSTSCTGKTFVAPITEYG